MWKNEKKEMTSKEDKPVAQEDFYRHVNHAWLSDPSVVIPAEYSRWGSFMMLLDESLKNQIEMLAEVADGAASEDELRLARVWKASFKRFEDWAAGRGDYEAVFDELDKLEAHLARGEEGLAEYLARCQEFGIGTPIVFDKECNLEASNDVVLDLSPSGLSLPSRDYYLDDKFDKQRAWFREHLDKVAELVGRDKLHDDFAAAVFRFETQLAMINMKTDQSRQFDKYYTITSLDALASGLNDLKHLPEKLENYAAHESEVHADVFCEAECTVDSGEQERVAALLETMVSKLGLREVMKANYAKHYGADADPDAVFRVMAFDGDYLRRFFKLVLREDFRADMRAFLQYKVIKAGASYCTKELNEEVFDLYARKLRGQSEQKSEEKRTVNLINGWLGELVGRLYVERHFSPADKEAVSGMIRDVLDIMADSLKANDWLTQGTKDKALDKLAKFNMKIGFPDKWKSYDLLRLEESDSLFVMSQKVTAFEFQTELLAKVNAPKDKTEWAMTPQTVNAYFSPLLNEIVFPAAIIQPPFYVKDRGSVDFALEPEEAALGDDLIVEAANFGGIGAVIAHEITHGYDDQGKKFNGDGNIDNWWTDEDVKLFTSKTAIMSKQAELWTYEEQPEDGAGAPKVHRMNGELTMGENIADLGGMSLACKALEKRLQARGLAPEQRKLAVRVFFKSWATIWRCKETSEFTINALNTDPHAPTSFRANLVKNVDSFYEAFDVKPEDAMYLDPGLRVQLW